jgi:hypothetical protein
LICSTKRTAVPKVELLYDADCPNVDVARTRLKAAFVSAGLDALWSEHITTDALGSGRRWGSPTILVEGRDVDASNASEGASCRLYRSRDGALAHVPPIEAIVAALQKTSASRSVTTAWKRNLGVVPGIAASLLPKIACPACWPAYAGFLGSIGLGFLISTAWLFPLTAAFLTIAVGALAFRARNRRGYAPALLGVVAMVVVLVGKFGLESNATMYGGLVVLVGASLWNTWPRKQPVACSRADLGQPRVSGS